MSSDIVVRQSIHPFRALRIGVGSGKRVVAVAPRSVPAKRIPTLVHLGYNGETIKSP